MWRFESSSGHHLIWLTYGDFPFTQIFRTVDGAIDMHVLGDVNSPNKCLITAGKHGCEPEGVVIVQKFLMPFIRQNDFFGRCFIVFPNLNPNKINACLDLIERGAAKSYAEIYKHRMTAAGVNLNGDFPTSVRELGDVHLRARQTQIQIDAVERYGVNLLVDLHTNGQSATDIYKYDEPIGCDLCKTMSVANGVVARDYVHIMNKGRVRSGTAGTYFGYERGYPNLTIEFGRGRPHVDFFQHVENLWQKHKPAFECALRADIKGIAARLVSGGACINPVFLRRQGLER